MKISEAMVIAVRTGTKFAPLVAPGVGEPLVLWADRRGDLHLTPAKKSSIIKSQVATGEGAGPRNGPDAS